MRTLLSGLALSLVLSGAALAQDTSPMLAKLHDDLHLSASQEAPWRQYVQAVSAGGQMQSRRQSAAMMMPQLTTPRRLALMDANMTQDLADFHRQSQAVTAFYEALSTNQQRTFDRDTLPAQSGAAQR